MKAKIISQSELPDTYEEWHRDYVKNVIEPFQDEIYFIKEQKMRERRARRKAIVKEKFTMREHYGYQFPKIDHVNIEFDITL